VDRLEISSALQRAADYIDAHGLNSGGFGDSGGPVCVNAAIAIGVGAAPSTLGRWVFFRRGLTAEARLVAEVIVRSRLLEILPPPASPAWVRRRARPSQLDERAVLAEVARWSDAPGRTGPQAVGALRARASAVLTEPLAGYRTEGSYQTALVLSPARA